MGKKLPIIFISHITEEARLASILKSHITNDFPKLFEVFVSSEMEGVEAGVVWLDQVRKSLHKAAFELLLCSRVSVTRPWVNFEAGGAWLKGIPIIPVCHSGFLTAELPQPFSALHAVEASQKNGLERIYHRIATTVGVEIPEVDFEEIIREVKVFEASYDVGISRTGVDMGHGRRIAGSWQGSGFDVEVPGHLEYSAKLSYDLNLTLARRNNTVVGEFSFYAKEVGDSGTMLIELIHVAEEYFYFKYWLADAHSNHCGLMLLQLSVDGHELKGVFLTNKVRERQVGIGRVEFRR